MIITKENYKHQYFHCDWCKVEYTGNELDLESSDDDELWILRCPDCGDIIINFWKEEPEFQKIKLSAMKDENWFKLEELNNLIQFLNGKTKGAYNGEFNISKLVSSITAPFIPSFLRTFQWMGWQEGSELVLPGNINLLKSLSFEKSIALLYTSYRADRFNDGLINELVKNGVLKRLVERILEFR